MREKGAKLGVAEGRFLLLYLVTKIPSDMEVAPRLHFFSDAQKMSLVKIVSKISCK